MTAASTIPDRRRNTLSPLSGEFTRPAQEAEFRASIWHSWHRRSRTLVLVGAAAYLISALTDYLLLGAGTLFLLILAGRVLVAGYGLGFILVATRRCSPRFSDYGLLVFLLLLVSMFLAMTSVRPDWERYSAPASVLILCVFYAMPMTRLWITMTSTLYLSFGMLAVALWIKDTPPRDIDIFGVQMLAINLIGFFIALRLHQDARLAWINQQSLEHRERHQRLLAHLSSQFLGLHADQIDDVVGQAFRSLCDYTGSDRAFLMEFDPSRETASLTHEWCREGTPAAKAIMQNVPAAMVPWASLKMQRGEAVQADRVSDLPPEASAERELSLAQGVKSFLCVPLMHEGQLLGMIGLGCVRQECAWRGDDAALLRFVGQAVFNALQRARAEEALRASETQFQALTSLSPVGILQADADGYYRYVNERWTQLSGLPREMLLGDRWRRALHPDDVERVAAAWNDAVARKIEFADEYRFRRPDGSVIWVHARARPQLDAHGQVLGFIGAIDDITERKQAHLEIEQRARLDEFVSSITVKFLQEGKTDTDGMIRRALAEVGHFTGADHCRLFLFDLDTQTKSCLHEWCCTGVEPQIQHLQNIPIAGFDWACPLILRGDIVDVPDVTLLPPEAATEKKLYEQLSFKSLLLVPIVSAGQVAGFINLDAVRTPRSWTPDTVLLLRIAGETIMSALHREQVEQAQQQHIRELETVNLELERRNTDLQKLAYVTSHDLQEPLRTISGFSSMLGQKYSGRLDAQADEYIRFVIEASDRLHKLINDLLIYTRIDHQVRVPVQCDLNEITQVVLDNLKETAQQLKARIVYHDMPTVVAEPLQMIQLMQHLVANALRFHRDTPPVVRVSAELNGAEWMISVADNGIGIAPEHAKRVFEVFERLNRSDHYPGTGIGLAVCRRIVERHGGRIWVEPNLPNGCVFRWTLPVRLGVKHDRSDESRHAA